MKRTVILLVVGLIVGGCSTVPLRTMWRLRNFSVQNVTSIDPNELRARIILPVDMLLKPDSSHIVIELTDDKGHGDSYKFPLEIIEREEITQGRFRKKHVALSTLRLSRQAVSDFVRFQKGLRIKERKHGRAGVHVSSAFDRSETFKKGETPKPFELSILLKLKANEDYFTLIDKAKIIKFEKNKPEQKKDEPEQNSSLEDKKQPVNGND
ncbi:MAG: hypothetical protein HQ580_05830 [Planctomycetes bacterium]|nr:hypothetical protein [Planctomycetota bacterium]